MNYKDIILKAEDLSNAFLELIEELKKSDAIDIKRETIQDFQKRIGYVSNNHENHNMNLAHMIYVQSVYTHEQKMNWRRQIVRIKKILDELEKK